MLPKKLPLTILTGFLGAGKTTLLNRILTGEHGLRVGVIVNEFGEIGIDGSLVLQADDQMIELNNGCVCCTVREDLLVAVAKMMDHKPPVEYLLVETTGLADPVPIAQTFMSHGVIDVCRLDAIITVVDAHNFEQHLAADPVAQSQLAFGDLILLNKVDLVSPEEADQIEARIRQYNDDARIIRGRAKEVDLELILGVGAFDPDRLLASDEPHHRASTGTHRCEDPHCGHPHHAHSGACHPPHHSQEIESFSFRSDRPLDGDRLNEFLCRLPINILRGKGILNIAQLPDLQVIMHQVGDRHDFEPGPPWTNEVRESRLVFIGKGLDHAALRRELDACFA